MSKILENKTIETNEEQHVNPFARRSKLHSSPDRSDKNEATTSDELKAAETKQQQQQKPQQQLIQRQQQIQQQLQQKQKQQQTPQLESESENEEVDVITVEPIILTSPRQEFIKKMRREEEKAFADSKKLLRKMKSTIKRLRNVSTDIKDAVSELEEHFCVMEHSRANWIKLESDKKLQESRIPAAATSTMTPVTPATSQNKRIASSPIEEGNTAKRSREQDPERWQSVTKKRKNRKTRIANETEPNTNPQITPRSQSIKRKRLVRRPKAEALLIKPTEGHSYAEVLKNLRSNVETYSGFKVKGIRKTRTGALLMEFGKGERVKPEFCEQLKATLKESANVESAQTTATIVMRNLDAITSKEEVMEELNKILPDIGDELKVNVTKPDSREQVRAYATLSEEKAQKLTEIAFIKIGFIRTKMTLVENVKKCYRCFGLGHFQFECKGPDRKAIGLCIRCGGIGHKMKECANTPKCWTCVDSGQESVEHMTGSAKCPASKKQNINRQ